MQSARLGKYAVGMMALAQSFVGMMGHTTIYLMRSAAFIHCDAVTGNVQAVLI